MADVRVADVERSETGVARRLLISNDNRMREVAAKWACFPNVGQDTEKDLQDPEIDRPEPKKTARERENVREPGA